VRGPPGTWVAAWKVFGGAGVVLVVWCDLGGRRAVCEPTSQSGGWAWRTGGYDGGARKWDRTGVVLICG